MPGAGSSVCTSILFFFLIVFSFVFLRMCRVVCSCSNGNSDFLSGL